MKLNLGAGSNKIEGFINIDINPENKPDVICDILKGLPYETGSIEEVALFHTIEHIEKWKQKSLLLEIRRVLKPDGMFLVSYPESSKCLQNWLDNKYGEREFWEATIYGRQLFKEDYHVTAMDSTEFRVRLKEAGLNVIKFSSEPNHEYNTIAFCTVDIPFVDYEIGLLNDMQNICK